MKTKKKDDSKLVTISPLSVEELRARIDAERDPHMAEAMREMLAGCEAHPGERSFYTLWVITLRDGTEVGSLGFRGAPVDGAVEIGYGIAEPYRGMGHCKAAVRQALDWAFSQEGVYFVTAETTEDNAASIAVLTALGFQETGKRGGEGPVYELEKPAATWTSVYIGIGMCIGVALGTSMDNLAVGLSLGMGIGLALGASLDRKDKADRAALREKRGFAPVNDEDAEEHNG